MEKLDEIGQALNDYFAAIKRLKELRILTNSTFFNTQLGEWLAITLFDGEKAKISNQKDWDNVTEQKHIQVKTHAKASTNTSRYSVADYDQDAIIDELIIIIFTEDYILREFYRVPWKIAYPKIRPHAKGGRLYWDDLNDYKVEIATLPNQEIVSLFI